MSCDAMKHEGKGVTLKMQHFLQLFRRDEEAKKKLLTSYKLMLDFYGIELVSDKTGEVKRAVNWKERFANLNRLILSFLFL